ncbi:hypothetical protein Dimus_036921, partial [Dionaea muscipula]
MLMVKVLARKGAAARQAGCRCSLPGVLLADLNAARCPGKEASCSLKLHAARSSFEAYNPHPSFVELVNSWSASRCWWLHGLH